MNFGKPICFHLLLVIALLFSMDSDLEAFSHNPRKLAFAALATSFSISIIPSSIIGIIEEFPSDGDALGGGFLMMFAMFGAFIIWTILISLITNLRPFKALCYGIAIIMTISFAFNCLLIGFNMRIFLLLLANCAYFILCAYLIEKAKSLPLKIIAITLTLTSFVLPFMALTNPSI